MSTRLKPSPRPVRTWEDTLSDLREAARTMPDRVMDLLGRDLDEGDTLARELDSVLYDAAAALDEQGNEAAELRGRVETLEEELGNAMDALEDTLTVDELGTLLERIGLRRPAYAGWTPDAIREVLGQIEWDLGRARRAV